MGWSVVNDRVFSGIFFLVVVGFVVLGFDVLFVIILVE